MIYFDNAATGGFKPRNVQETAIGIIKYLLANPGRSGHRLSRRGAEFVYSARKRLSNFFNNDCIEKVIFTKNCSEALNMSILGSLKQGDKVITTIFEHNSVLRPLFSLRDKNIISLTVIAPENKKFITKNDVEKHFDEKTKAVIINHASNVTGAISDIDGIGDFLKDKNCLFIVDGAQSGGHLKIDMIKQNIDILCLAGHKGLYAISGSGVLLMQKHVDIDNVYSGGTGTESFNPHQPTCYPEKLEVGTLNLPSICSLEEGIRYIQNSIDFIGNTLLNLTEYLICNLKTVPYVTIYSCPNQVGIVSFSIKDISSIEVSEILSSSYDICVRGGFHCAPLVHRFLKTDDDGLIRISLSPHNTKKEIDFFINSINEIVSSI